MGKTYKVGETYTDNEGRTYTILRIVKGIDSRYSQITYAVKEQGQPTRTSITTATKFTRTLNGRKVQTMTAAQKNKNLQQRIFQRTQVPISEQQARQLRLAETTLQRWAEGECGDSNNHMAWSIERDEMTNIPYRVTHYHNKNKPTRTRLIDLETNTLKRVQNVTASLGLHFYHQGDPRGCSLYVAKEPLNDQNYTDGVCCAVD